MALGEYLWAGSWITRGLYHFDNNGNDSSGNSANLTTSNISYTKNTLWGLWYCAILNGSNSNASTNSSLWWDNGNDYTVSTWVRLNSVDSIGRSIIALRHKPSSTSMGIYYNNTSFFGGKVRRAMQDAPSISTSVIWTSQWHNIIIWYDALSVTTWMYVDWKLVASDSLLGTWSWETANITTIWTASNSPNAYIDEIICERRLWSGKEVQKYYTYAKWRYWAI